MKVKAAMSSTPDIIPMSAMVDQAANEMLKNDFGFMLVGDKDNIEGIITDRDITLRVTAKGKDPKNTSIKEVMSKKVITCHEEDDIKDAATTMGSKQIRRLLVLDKDEHAAGVISFGDIARKCDNDKELCGNTIIAISAK